MRYGQIPHISKPVSLLGLGSMVCSTDRPDETNALLDAWAASGGTLIDTARVYGEKSERAIGKWMKARGNREKIVLLGKGAHHDSSGPRVNPQSISEDLHQSLERFETDYIDLYLLHRDDPNIPVGPIVEALNEQHSVGRIRAFGGSNWSTSRLQEAHDYAVAHGLQGFSASSPYFGLAATNEVMWPGCLALDAEGVQWHAKTLLPLIPWSSQASGFFTGRYAPDDTSNADVARVYYNEGNWERLNRARQLAEKKGVSANNIALAYVLHQSFPVFALIGPRSVSELESSLPALDVALTDAEARWLNLESESPHAD